MHIHSIHNVIFEFVIESVHMTCHCNDTKMKRYQIQTDISVVIAAITYAISWRWALTLHDNSNNNKINPNHITKTSKFKLNVKDAPIRIDSLSYHIVATISYFINEHIEHIIFISVSK